MLYLDDVWQDNSFTVLANIQHQRVHSGKTLVRSAQKVTFSDVWVYSERLGLYGKCDELEFVKSAQGMEVPSLGGGYCINIIEFKPTQSKVESKEDRLQVYAQYLCVRDIFGDKVSAYLFYSDVHRRVKLEFSAEDETLLSHIIEEINHCTEIGQAPKAEFGDHCNGCSLKDKCMPKVTQKKVKDLILENKT